MRKKCFKALTVWMWVCIAVSICMRAVLFSMGYEYDELFTAATSDPSLSFPWIYKNWLMADVHPPLYNALMWVWNQVFPYGGEVWLRLPSFFLGLAALAEAWFLFPKRFGKTVRLTFFSLLSCSAYLIAYAQHARSYMLVLLFAVPLTFVFLDICQAIWSGKEITKRQWVLFGVWSVLSCWSHYFGALLFGSFSVVLFAQALYYKRNIKWFIITPCVVFVLFLPWLIPNILTQLEYQRFEGNWWANTMPNRYTLPIMIQFFFSDLRGIWILGPLLLVCGFLWAKKAKYFRQFSRNKEMLVLSAVLVIAFAVVGLISIKTYMFIGRYFTSFLPSLFLLFALLIAPLLRRSIVANVVFILFLIFCMGRFVSSYLLLVNPKNGKMPARVISQYFRDYFRGKEMFVIAIEAFPPPVMPAMYGHYVNKMYHLKIPVTELYSLDEAQREAALVRRDKAVIWMPNCTTDLHKLPLVAQKWHRNVDIVMSMGNICVLQIGDRIDQQPQNDKKK